ncbi:hypothetical protein BU046_10870 [Staphylococcus simulans]|uniref:hypothetical protein n=1 Tax=Staphylococcus simulans TaxID=1286 RepID=UPI000D1E564B|nr:hypothetical protein [Staphylococcus simulans]PTI93442.1 hypothetical protein BU045_05955 [Staphylococcus simulans]PTJ03356.1 hypothetical protein BU046_10870 [Staphylococcus simulans]PTJ97126.1 hypothetical protein BU013_04790 [Staphylococcus simulans]
MGEIIEYKELLNEFNKTIPDAHDTMESRTNDSGGGNMSGNYITKEMFEQFEKRIDDKLDSLPDRMADKMDAKISKFEAKQTKWFVGIGITLIGTFLKVFGII